MVLKFRLILVIILLIILLLVNLFSQKLPINKENFDSSRDTNKPLKLECVLGAVNTNPKYLHFIPLFLKSWKKFYPETDVKIILIADKIPEEYQKYSQNIILYQSPNPKISTAFISQFIRLLYPGLLPYKNGVMITDIDNIPLNNKFFKDNLSGLNTSQWVNLRDWTDENQICMMWQIATPKLWREVFQVENIKEIDRIIEEVNSKIEYTDGATDKNWFTDQFYLYDKVMAWNQKTNKYIYLKDKDTGFNRLDRLYLKEIDDKLRKELENGKYSDYHALRPPQKYEKINNELVDFVRV